MDIRVVEAPPTPLKVVTPEELCEGRPTVTVVLERPITLQVETCIVTYSIGEHRAPCVIANILFAQGGEIVGADGCFIKRESPKPAPMRYVGGPFEGTRRWKLS
jgi:hypothetical protein